MAEGGGNNETPFVDGGGGGGDGSSGHSEDDLGGDGGTTIRSKLLLFWFAWFIVRCSTSFNPLEDRDFVVCHADRGCQISIVVKSLIISRPKRGRNM